MGRMSRDKGAVAERELWHILNDVYGFETRRGDCFRGQNDLVNIVSIHPEVKRVEELKLTTWLKQAVESAAVKHDGLPVVFHRKNRQEWLVSMLKTDFEKMEPKGVTIKIVTGKADPAKDLTDCDAVQYFRKIGDVITMTLSEWVGIYWEWKAPFAEN